MFGGWAISKAVGFSKRNDRVQLPQVACMLAGRLAARQAVKMGKSPQQAGQEVRQGEGVEMRWPCRKPMVFFEATSFSDGWIGWKMVKLKPPVFPCKRFGNNKTGTNTLLVLMLRKSYT